MNRRETRFYVDILAESSGFYVNPVPEFELSLGDYGQLERKSGQFERAGNIFEDDPSLAASFAFTKPVSSDKREFFGSRCKGTDHQLSADVSMPADIADCSFKWNWSIDSGRHAFLIMIQPQLHAVKNVLRLIEHLKANLVKFPTLSGCVLVTQVIRCETYAMHLTSNQATNYQIHIGFKAQIPTTPLSAGAMAALSWKTASGLGNIAIGNYRPGEIIYTTAAKLALIEPASFFGRILRGEEVIEPARLMSLNTPLAVTESASVLKSKNASDDADEDDFKEKLIFPWGELDEETGIDENNSDGELE